MIDVEFVVRRDGDWWTAPAGDGREMERRTLAQVYELMASGSAPCLGQAVPVHAVRRPNVADLLAPASSAVIAVGGGQAVVADSSGRIVSLSDADLRLVGALTGVTTPLALASVLDCDPLEVSRRVGRLLDSLVIGIEADDVAQLGGQGGRSTHDSAQATDTLPGAGSEPASPRPSEKATPVRPASSGGDSRIPVYAVWHESIGPQLALGMVLAAARQHASGALTEIYEIRRLETAGQILVDLEARRGPAVLLCSDYVWSLEQNLELATAFKSRLPESVVIHGGPSVPMYERDAEQFLAQHSAADILVRGEGEHTLAECLEVLADSFASGDHGQLSAALEAVAGITFRSGDGVVRTTDRPRIVDLDALPSPYLTGEFDHLDAQDWLHCLSVETNRGCPYGCSFCDWGSATLSRIRRFDLDRVRAELEWAARHRIVTVNLTDANFGIMSRDVEIAQHIADLKREHRFPELVSYYPAKNTTKHLVRIMDVLLEVGIGPSASLSLQTSDPATLEAIERSNISTDHYVALAAEFRRRGHPLHGDLLLGLPGQSLESYRRDLQFNLDHEIQSRTWQVRVLPNAPMNSPEYRERFAIVKDAHHRVVATSTFSASDRQRMTRLRDMEIMCERFGVLRHIVRWLQWDHGLDATLTMMRLLDLAFDDDDRFPAMVWTIRNFDLALAPAIGWAPFFDQLRTFIVDDLGVEPCTAMDTALAVQEFMMPAPGRSFPATISLRHDYVSYYHEATERLYLDGHADRPRRRLAEWGPGVLEISDDPLRLCTRGVVVEGPTRDPLMEGDYVIGANCSFELMSPLFRPSSYTSSQGVSAPREIDEPAAMTADRAQTGRDAAPSVAEDLGTPHGTTAHSAVRIRTVT